MTPDDTLQHALDVVAAVKEFSKAVGREVPESIIAKYLRLAAEEAALVMPETPQHLGAVVEFPRRTGAAA